MFIQPDALLVKEYAALDQPFVYRVPATPLSSPATLLALNAALADEIGLDANQLSSPEGIQVLTGQAPWPGSESVASVYCGHQFGVFVPRLGDGRALLIAEIRKGAQYKQLQLKGAGPTPFSRHADGRAVLRSSIREYVASEALHHLGIPTTRALSLTGTADPVFRESTETAAVVCRVADSFLRFGHVEYFSHTQQYEALLELLGWHIERHHPELFHDDFDDQPTPTLLSWFKWLTQATAKLMAQWQSVGFCHGVMNTDNMSLLGLTIDYGPYGFLDRFNVDHICNHSDSHGRYSYRNQPRIGHWNLYTLASALIPLIPDSREALQAILDEYPQFFEAQHTHRFSQKMGLDLAVPLESQVRFVEYTIQMLHEHGLDMCRFFRSLGVLDASLKSVGVEQAFAQWQSASTFPWALGDEAHVQSAKAWLEQWLPLCSPSLKAGELNAVNPVVIPRNHLLQVAIEACSKGDSEPLNRLITALSEPYTENPSDSDLYESAPEWAAHLEISCSS